MDELDKGFTGSIPVVYDRYLVPLLFEPYAADLAARLGYLSSGRLLETAAGTGAVTRALLGALPDSVAMVATDLNQAMVEVAASRKTARNLHWRQADAMALPFADASFDAVVCQFGVMFFPDKLAGYREARRALKPGGRFVFNVWDRIEANVVSHIVSEAVASLFPDDPPRFLPRTPFGYYDIGKIREELATVGFRDVAIETVKRRTYAETAKEPAIGLCQGTPLRSEIEARDASRLVEATEVAARALAARLGPGPINNDMQAHVISALR